jgi:SAM-dependent methyltransferase
MCGSDRWFAVIEAADAQAGGSGSLFRVVQCVVCGLRYTHPRPTVAAIGTFYPEQYRPHRVGRRGQRQRWWRCLPLLRKQPCQEHRVLPWQGQGRLLDFGCGGGRFLQAMQRAGWQVTGVDASAAAVQTVRQELGLPVVQGSLPHAGLTDGSFDVVTMNHSLEHVHQPVDVLRAAWRLLAPGGKVVVAVPNMDSLAFRWFGRSWFALDLPRHLTHFTPDTLRRMLEHAGFCPGPVEWIGHSAWLRASASLAGRQHAAPRWQRLLRVRPLAWTAACYSCWTHQTDAMRVSALRP